MNIFLMLGPLVTREHSNYLLVGIGRGGGINCSRLDSEGYSWGGKTGDWMRVAAFKDVWIDKVIEQETKVGMKIL